MNIFNSLGSNYNLSYVLRSFFAFDVSASTNLKQYLEDKYHGQATLLYKGRHALELGLKSLDLPQNSKVAINGFTCYAVYKAIKNAGLIVEYIDIDQSLNFKASQIPSGVKVVIVQNTLGYPSQIDKITQLCKQKNIILIEDLAHSVGSATATAGDMVVLSFSQDKMIDGVSGGALIIRNPKYQPKTDLETVPLSQRLIDRLYPFWTVMIRSLYPIGIGKLLHAFLKSTNLLSQPMGNKTTEKMLQLPGWHAQLALNEFKKLPQNLRHRQKIATIYAQNLPPQLLSPALNISQSTNLRFPIFVENRSDLIQYLKANGIYISDIWYDAPIAPKKYLPMTDYQHQCPQSEKIAKQILNLPTHINVSEQQAKRIAERINKWLK